MPTRRTWRGRILDERGRPLEGCLVRAGARRVRPTGRALAEATSGPDGAFALTTSPWRRRLDVLALDPSGARPLARATWRWGRRREAHLLVPTGQAHGWLVRGLDGAPCALTHGNAIEPLVDGEAAFHRALDVVHAARRRLDVAQLLFEPDLLVPGRGLFARALVDADRRGVVVRLLLNENAAVPDHVDEARGYFQGVHAGICGVEVRAAARSPGVMHAKMVVADGREAVLVSPPFEQRFLDTPAHRVAEPARASERPIHDVSLHVEGPAVRHLEAAFDRLWGAPGPAGPPSPRGRARRAAPSLQVVTTRAGRVDLARGVLDAYARAFAEARATIYLEAQYFTSATITRALGRALARRPGLEAILVVNESMDVPTYRRWQDRRFAALGWPHHPRLGVFSLWSGERPIYVHSKVGLVDDAWATVGTANLDGLSLEGAHELGFPEARNEEVNLVLLDGIEGAPATGAARHLRTRLWSEHLALPPTVLHERPPEGWLPTWRRLAEDADRTRGGGVRVRPYARPPRRRPR